MLVDKLYVCDVITLLTVLMARENLRRLQRVGKATISVSLPKRWVRERGLKPGDLVMLVEEEDGSLRVRSPTAREEKVICTINAELCGAPGLLGRILVGCYHQGYDNVRVMSNHGFRREQLREVAETVDRLPGFEIVEQSPRRIVIQSFIDPAKFPLEGLLKRLQVIVATMLNNLIDYLETGRQTYLENIEELEEKVDELYFLILRLIISYLRRRELGEPLGIDSPPYASGARVVAKTLEEIADFLTSIAKELKRMRRQGDRLDKDSAKILRRYAEFIHLLFGKSMKSFFSVDAILANEVIEQVNEFIGGEESLSVSPALQGHPTHLQYMTWSLGYMVRNCRVIAEVALNRFVRNNTPICNLSRV